MYIHMQVQHVQKYWRISIWRSRAKPPNLNPSNIFQLYGISWEGTLFKETCKLKTFGTQQGLAVAHTLALEQQQTQTDYYNSHAHVHEVFIRADIECQGNNFGNTINLA